MLIGATSLGRYDPLLRFEQGYTPMALFFFHLVSPGSYCADEIGGEFPTVEAAYLDAWEAALEMGCEMLKERRDPCRHQFEITDDQGCFLLEVPFSEAMRPSGQKIRQPDIYGELRRQMQKSRDLGADIKAEFANTRLVLEITRAALARARACC
jgi:hypothetical protein